MVSIRLEPKLSDFGLSIIVECIYIECIITLLDKSLIKLFTEFTWTWHDKLKLLNYHLLFLHLKCHVFHGIWVYTNMKDCENMKNSWQPFLSGPLFYITHIFFYFFLNNFANTNCSVIFTSYTFQRLLYNKRWQGFIYLLSAFLGSVLGRPLLLY